MISVCCDFDLGSFISDVQILEVKGQVFDGIIHKKCGDLSEEGIFEKTARGGPYMMSKRGDFFL